MSKSEPAGMVQTVLGPVSADEVGITLPHEHLLMDFTGLFEAPEDPVEKRMAYSPLSLSNRDWIRRHYTSNLDNLKYEEEDIAVAEATLFKQTGGNTIVDASDWDLGRNP